jgi:hypothetical protein
MSLQQKMERLFKKLAVPCQFIPADGADPAARFVSVGNNRRESDSSTEYIADPVLLAAFLLSEGTPKSGDKFELNGEYFQLTQLYLVDEYTAQWIYI